MNAHPYVATMQHDGHCCQCGKLLPDDTRAVNTLLKVKIGSLLGSTMIYWCFDCWKKFDPTDWKKELDKNV